MLPITIVNNPVPVPLVNTTLPGTVITHVPYDNVAPSISSAQVNNNASPNSEAAAAGDQSEATQADTEQTTAALVNNAAQNQSPGAQATFLAQLLSQDGSPPAQVILVQYEKLIALSNVKYKPSNAFKPVPAPSNTFGQILQQSRPITPVQQVQAPQAPPRQPDSMPTTAEEEAILSNPTPDAPPPRPLTPPRNTNPSPNNTAANAAPQISAYTATAARVTTQSLETTTELA